VRNIFFFYSICRFLYHWQHEWLKPPIVGPNVSKKFLTWRGIDLPSPAELLYSLNWFQLIKSTKILS